MFEYKGCSDGNCILRIEPLKVHTNGGCRCLQYIPKPLQLAIKRKIWQLKQRIKELENESSRVVEK
jgi:hypothetical protein